MPNELICNQHCYAAKALKQRYTNTMLKLTPACCNDSYVQTNKQVNARPGAKSTL
jgi:hypothetical protein